MYECQMKMTIPSGVGLLVAGIASGICFLLIGSLRKGKGEKNVDDSRCACCLKPFLLGRGVECTDCGGRSCRKACCRWDSVDNAWFCLFCYHSRSWSRRKEKWFKNFGGLPVESEACENFSTAKSRVYDEGAEDVAIHPELDLAAGGCKEGDSMETVREFVEKIVEGLVGNVDDTPIDRLYDHPAYDGLFESYGVLLARALTRLAISLRQCVDNKPAATDTPTMAHTALRELVERAVDEARKLPALGPTVSTGIHDDLSFSEQNYEDLLATAILNKVIEKFQNERVDDNSNVLHRRSRSKLANDDNETDLNELEEGSSSVEPLSHDEHSGEENESRTRHMHVQKQPMSLTIEEQIEEVTTTYTSDEEPRSPKTTVLDFRNARRVPFPEFGMDIVDPSQDSSEESPEDTEDLAHVDRITPVESWEENWLFQKRKIQTQSEPVAMLVPNPSSDFRALIGDKDAEDTSDLSEFSAQSEDEEAEEEKLTEAFNGVFPKTGKIDTNFFGDFEEAGKISQSIKSNFFGDFEDAGKNSHSIKSNFIDDFEEAGKISQSIKSNFFGDFEEAGKISQSIKSNFRDPEEKDKIQDNLNNEPEIIYPINMEDEYKNGEKLKEKTRKLSDNSFDFVNYVATNSEIPKTSPMQNLISEKTSEIPAGCDLQQLNDKISSIDTIKSENEAKNEASKRIFQENSGEKVEKKDNQELDNEKEWHQKSFPIKECLKTILRDSDDDVVQEAKSLGKDDEKVLEKSFNEENKANEEAVIIEDEKIMANGIISQDTDSKCQALAQAKAEAAKEKPILRIETNENIGFATPPRPGTIAEREHKKWENAAPIENNPYSEENIQKRLLERQYARRSSDVSGSSSNLQTCPSPPLQIVLGAGRPDFRRFGRDYYINEAKFPRGHSIEESGFFTATSRPNSSLSQHSLSTGSDYEQQERSRSVETDSTCSTSSESRKKFSPELHKNNSRRGSMPIGKDFETSEMENRGKNFRDEIFESQRKNSKNEINAKLNNRENFDNNEKPIRRIDLSAYGFENQFNVKNGEKSKKMEKINKLDLRSFGYDSGLRRTQSNNNIDRRLNSKYNGRNFEAKSNNGINYGNPKKSDDEILTKSSENLEEDPEIDCQKFGKITSAKSVPNIGDLYSRDNDRYRKKNIDDFPREKSTTENSEKCNFGSINNIDYSEVEEKEKSRVGQKLPMPSVRILAQAFDKSAPANPVAARRPSKSSNVLPKERPTTPEVHIVDSPRQMHSLTARSLSREFREGLRQISTKQAPQSKSNGIPEQNRSPDVESSPNPITGSSEDVSVIAPGKLKNNIQFWEQLNKKS